MPDFDSVSGSCVNRQSFRRRGLLTAAPSALATTAGWPQTLSGTYHGGTSTASDYAC